MSKRSLADVDELTPAERNMMRALLEGSDSLDIARDYRKSPTEIERDYLAPAFAKLGVSDATELRERFTL